jgi:phosphatidylserine decarboxylase
MWDYIKTAPFYVLPQHLLSKGMYRATRWRFLPWKNLIIKLFIRYFQVDIQIAEQSEVSAYADFNEFFTRKLKAEHRPVDNTPRTIVSPVDGSISQIGEIHNNSLIQAKGKYFNLPALLAADLDTVQHFINGHFATIYLSPRDYHRIHLPVDARLIKMTYVPGDLFSVNEASSRAVDQLFARNERLICLFETEYGLMTCILVAAIFVGGMETIWAGEVTPAKVREIRSWDYSNDKGSQTKFLKGEEMARFNMGSTVILLFQEKRIEWSQGKEAGALLKMGEVIGTAND